MKTAEKFFKALDRIACAFTAVCVGGMLLCVFLQVVARSTGLSVNWTTEMSQYCFLWSTTFGTYVAARRGKMIGVEMVRKKMPFAVQRVMKFLSWGSAAFFYGFVIYHCAANLPRLWKTQTPILKWSMGLIYLIMLVGLSMITLYSVYLALRGLLDAPDKKDTAKKTAEQLAEEVE